MKLPANPSETHQVEIGKPVYGGAFLARLEGKAVFVPLGLPGEQARIRIAQSRPGYAAAEAEEIVTPSAERIRPACPHFGACGGCHYQHTNHTTQLAFKQAILRETLERGGVRDVGEIAVLSGAGEAQTWGYRNRIRLAFDAAGRPGYRGRRSHAVIPMEQCPIAAPVLVEAARAAAEAARQCAPRGFTEVELFTNADESALLLSAFAAQGGKTRLDEFVQRVKERVPALAGAALVVDGGEGRRGPVQPPRTVAQWGAKSLTYRAAGFDYRVDHGAFFQVNRWLVDALVEKVTAGRRGALAWDLFAGVGLFARRLTASFDRVLAVEAAPAATKALARNLKDTASTPIRATTFDFLRDWRAGSAVPDLIVADPPRAGLGADTCGLLATVGAPAITYVSCDPATLARDLRALLAEGYRIESITLADLFPQTFHIECVAEIKRN